MFVQRPSKNGPNDSLATTSRGCVTIERPLLGVGRGRSSIERCSRGTGAGMQDRYPPLVNYTPFVQVSIWSQMGLFEFGR